MAVPEGGNAMLQSLTQAAHGTNRDAMRGAMPTREEVCNRIFEVGVIPALRVESPEDALFVAEALTEAGIPIVEVASNVPGGANIVSYVVKHAPGTIVGAGNINTEVAARQCLDAGAKFLTSAALVLEVVKLAAKEDVAVIPGAFTATEIVAARNAGSDFVKVIPCDAGGGSGYIRSLKSALPDIPMIAAGGVTQQTALSIVAAGATALGIGRDLLPADAIRLREARRIQELARRFLSFVDNGRIEAAGRNNLL